MSIVCVVCDVAALGGGSMGSMILGRLEKK